MESAPPSLATQRAMLRVGRVLRDKWRLESVLGTGGIGAVYAATHRTGKRVAIKILHPELSAVPEARSALLARGVRGQRHRAPGRRSRCSTTTSTRTGCVFLVMELLEGETLEARARAGRRQPRFRRRALARRSDARRARGGARKGHRAPRSQARERVSPAATGSSSCSISASRKLREAPRGKALTAQGHRHRHARVHAARAGARPVGDGRRAQRSLRGRRDDLHLVDGPARAWRPRRRKRRSSRP